MRLAAILTFCAAPAVAQTVNTVSLPAGCEAYVTVQDRSCQVDHHFRCEGDPAGEQQRMAFDELGMTYLGRIDAETQWLESFHARSGHAESLISENDDPASLSDLLATNRDTYNFVTESIGAGFTNYVGQDSLTGKTVVIDGVTLQQTAFEITAFGDGGETIWSAKGNEFVHPEWRIFLSGTSTVTSQTDSFDRDGTPVEFIFPGEPGFLSTRPKYGCGVMLSAAPSLQENAHDNL